MFIYIFYDNEIIYISDIDTIWYIVYACISMFQTKFTRPRK
jgi:hypothetical protein